MKIYLFKEYTYDICNQKTDTNIEIYDSYEAVKERAKELEYSRGEISISCWDWEIEVTELEESLNVLFYKGFCTAIKYRSSTKTLCGKIENIYESIEFESDTCEGIEKEFHKAVDKYLEDMNL